MQKVFDFFSQELTYLKGVGPAKAAAMAQEGLRTYGDLLDYFPFRYIDKSNFIHISQIKDDKSFVVLKGKIIDVKEIGAGRNKRLTAVLKDETGIIDLIWFSGIKYISTKVRLNKWYSIFGKPVRYFNDFNITHPEIEEIDPSQTNTAGQELLQPVYSLSEKMKKSGLTIRSMAAITKNLLLQAERLIPETLPLNIIHDHKLMPREEAYRQIHHPSSLQEMNKASRRLKFEELFLLQMIVQLEKQKKQQQQGHIFDKVGDFFLKFYNNNLPFELTGAQKRVIKEIRSNTKTGFQMNRLLQGDVGSGKTMVALMTMLIACDNNYQACLMVPTEILARQHFTSISKMLKGLDVNVAILTGSTLLSERRTLLPALKDGQINILIGTHALLEDKVEFNNLGLVVIDEQHRFGVAQRARLWKKNNIPPHVLVMTATPIPRTLGMTLYGDLEISVIDELPLGRKEVKTVQSTDAERLKLFGFIKREIAKGRQAYIVYPLIQESEKFDLKDLMDGYKSIERSFPAPDYNISIVHGKMKSDTKDYEMQRFKKGETQIMVSTTVIEVGVDVPNATVMVIENSERFGLSQLHQLRGRVGRGGEQSYCILMTKDNLSKDARERIETMVSTTDGFKIAEVDMRLRGPGNIQGTQQSGMPKLKIADIVEDEELMHIAKASAIAVLKEDPHLEMTKNFTLRKELNEKKHGEFWAKIS
ncbi:MAG: ATP-dependent DNA helicase RecG [Bacteroidales bacterium]|jgi:ATP-dependent DNA helicase RecG|nr:ATP-dependent DNA helicase RecG [Bacteroidales bacterium]